MHDVVWMTAALFGMMLALSAHAHFQHPQHRERFVVNCRNAWSWCRETAIDLYCRVAGYVLEKRDQLVKFGERQSAPPLTIDRMQLFEYLVLLRTHPDLAAPPRVRLAKAIRDGGVDWRRTLELRIRTGRKRVFAWKVFADMPGLDLVALHEMVMTLEHGMDKILLLVGPAACGKTMLIERLTKLLGELYLPVVDGMPMNFNPLRLLHYTENKAQAEQIMRRYGVSRYGIRAAAPLTPLERKLVKRATKGYLVEAYVMFVRIADAATAHHGYQGRWSDRDQLIGHINIEMLGRCPDDEAMVLDGALQVSNGGLLVADEALKNDADTKSLLVDAALGYTKTPHLNTVRRHGLIIMTANPRELEHQQQGHESALLDYAHSIQLNPITDKGESERFVATAWKKVGRNMRAKVQLDPAVVPYLAMVMRLSAPQLTVRILHQVMQRVIEKSSTTDTRNDEGTYQPVTVANVAATLTEYFQLRFNGLMQPQVLQQVAAAIKAADEWLALPHPVIGAKRKVNEVVTDFKKHMADSKIA